MKWDVKKQMGEKNESKAMIKQWSIFFCLIFCFNLSAEVPMSKINPHSDSFRIQPFESKYQAEVMDLIERIQVGEFHIPIEEGQGKELQSIPSSFQKGKSNYWIALFNDKVIGTIAVIDIGHHAFELRDVFLDKDYRGAKTGYGKRLLDTVLEWSKTHCVKTIYLGTTLAFRAASFL
jgi:GNAT superfamily N-acetyltransferase